MLIKKYRTAFFQIGQTKIELLQSTEPDGPIGKFIEKKGEGIHHIAFAVEKIEDQLEHASKMGVNLIDTTPRKGAEGTGYCISSSEVNFRSVD